MKNEIDWEDIEAFLAKLIRTKPQMKEGVDQLDKMFLKATGRSFLPNFNIVRYEEEYKEWMNAIFSSEKTPNHINSLYFGLFTLCEERYNDGKETTAIHMIGTSANPEEDDDWACEDEDSFLSDNRYFIFSDFISFDNLISEIKPGAEAEVLLFNGMLCMLLGNNIALYKDQILTSKHKKGLTIGFGFDSGDVFILGKLTTAGLV